MDLTTVRENLEKGNIKTVWDFERDIRQIFWNCFRFNDSMAAISQQGQALLSFFNRLWYNDYAEPDCLKGDDERVARNLLSLLMKQEYAALFTEPVDIYAIPEYKERIKSPMDLRTMTENLTTGRYTSLKQVDGDLRLMFDNCFKFNNSKSFAYDQGKRLERYYHNNGGKEIRARIKEQQRQNTPGKSDTVEKHSPSSASTTKSASKSVSPFHSRHNLPSPVRTVTTGPLPDKPTFPPASPSSVPKARSTTTPPIKAPAIVPPVRPASTGASPSVATSTPVATHPSAQVLPSSTSSPAKLLPGLHTKLDALLVKLKKNKNAAPFLIPVSQKKSKGDLEQMYSSSPPPFRSIPLR